jgi:dipeptidyl aminopeptidase/acylaminoacyl peptidase
MEKEIYFYSNSIKLPGTISFPEDLPPEKGWPAVILSHGYGASREEFGDFIMLSGFLRSIKIAALRFDFSGCGRSDFLPGRMLCGSQWIDDLKNAVSFLSVYPNIDRQRICMLGESMGAAAAISAAADDRRVKIVISLSAIADGFEWVKNNWLKNKNKREFNSFLNTLEEDGRREAAYRSSNLVRMSDALAYEKRYTDLIEEIRKVFDDRSFTYYIQYASISSIFSLKPLKVVKKIAPRPLLILAGKKDEIVPCEKNSQKLFKRAGTVKKMIVYDEGDHGLFGGPAKEDALGQISEWLTKYL